ncbi:MAG: sigma factor [Roseovarius sp.]|jgi:DNA-directed RNA polymerase specialized sigma24 family protein
MTNEQFEIIQIVIDRIAKNYTFSYYEEDDIRQEAFIIAAEALKNYDSSRPLENFISRHLANRLKNLIRDKYYRSNTKSKSNFDKRAVMDLSSLQVTDANEPYYCEDQNEKLCTTEALELVKSRLSPKASRDFLRKANGVPIRPFCEQRIEKETKEILGEDW